MIEKRHNAIGTRHKSEVRSFVILIFLVNSVCFGVNSSITRHSSSADLLKGEAESVVVGSDGTIGLGRSAESLVEKFEDVWSINSIVVSGGSVFVGTSPNGGIYKYSLGKLTKIYSAEPEDEAKDTNELADANEPADSNSVSEKEQILNEHIFAMATDAAGRLLAGVSGETCKLMRFESGKMETVFEPNDAKYIFAIAVSEDGNIYLGTGAEGKIYELDSFGKNAKVIYDSPDKNILSLVTGIDGFLYAGSDGRGLIYKVSRQTKTVTVLYDSKQPEITSLLLSEAGELYAAATSAKMVKGERRVSKKPLSGRPEVLSNSEDGGGKESGLKLNIANTEKKASRKPSLESILIDKGVPHGEPSYIYKITEDGFVTDVFKESSVFFSLALEGQTLYVGTGNDARLITVDLLQEQEGVVYEDEQASQVTAVVAVGEDVYVGTSNPAKLIKLGRSFASKGSYSSDLIDAGQPAKWGKLQIEADIPKGCKVQVACRSGNVEDVNDPTFSEWTELIEVTEPVQLDCPVGRFCQYKLVLESEDGASSPVVREIAVGHSVGNLAPKVRSVRVGRISKENKAGVFKISYNTEDKNQDELVYKINFRMTGRSGWIELEEKHESKSFEWDGKTVEDGRYEIRVTASDERSNTSETKLEGSRISDAVVVDNTGPVIKKYSIKSTGKGVELNLVVSDKLSAIGKVHYTIDSNSDWVGTVPEDLVYDTTEERFVIAAEVVKAGEHIITVKVSDAVGNVTYKTFEFNIAGN